MNIVKTLSAKEAIDLYLEDRQQFILGVMDGKYDLSSAVERRTKWSFRPFPHRESIHVISDGIREIFIT